MKKFTSFARQLNIYGFRVIRGNHPQSGSYFHFNFRRYHHELLRGIIRVPIKCNSLQQKYEKEVIMKLTEKKSKDSPPKAPFQISSDCMCPPAPIPFTSSPPVSFPYALPMNYYSPHFLDPNFYYHSSFPPFPQYYLPKGFFPPVPMIFAPQPFMSHPSVSFSGSNFDIQANDNSASQSSDLADEISTLLEDFIDTEDVHND